jgi:hypothetical protein
MVLGRVFVVWRDEGTGNPEADVFEEGVGGVCCTEDILGNRRLQVAVPAMPSAFKPAACWK